MTKKFAFTLAEVLIALAIIGVVAAMTIPTFMANTAGAQFKTGLKKTIAVLTNAAAANYATEGYDFGTANASASATSNGHNSIGDAYGIVGFDTASSTESNDDLGSEPSLFHVFQNNLNMKNAKEIKNYPVAGTPTEMSCAGRGTAATLTAETGQRTDYGVRFSSVKIGENTTTVTDNMKNGGIRNLCDPSPLVGTGESGNGGINQGRMFQLEDGSVFTWDPTQAYCTESVPCYGYIDVNGPTGPNRVIGCSAVDQGINNDAWISTYGRNALEADLNDTCTVEAKDITDIYPVVFYNSAVKPATRAGKAVLYNTKSNQKASS